MIGLHAPHAERRRARVPKRVQRVAAFGLLLLGARLLAEVLLLAGPLSFLRPADGPSPAQVAGLVRQHAAEWNPARDPLITVAGGVQVKSSNVHGVEIGNVRYYYHFTRTFSFDPLARGEVQDYAVVAVLDPGGPFEAEVYRLD